MEMLCPECLGPLATQDGQTAQCTLDGKRYRILFSRYSAPVASAQGPAGTAPPGQVHAACPRCQQRFRVAADSVGKSARCTKCNEVFQIAAEASPSPPAPPPFPAERAAAGAMCAQHPNVPALRKCRVCHAAMCATCDFELPGGVHVCPKCAAAPQTTLSPRRKKYLAWAYGLAIWATLGAVLLFSGAFTTTVHSKEELQAIGTVIFLLLYVPAIIGTAMGCSALDKRLGNPPVVWVAMIWNAIILAGLILLSVVGSLS